MEHNDNPKYPAPPNSPPPGYKQQLVSPQTTGTGTNASGIGSSAYYHQQQQYHQQPSNNTNQYAMVPYNQPQDLHPPESVYNNGYTSPPPPQSPQSPPPPQQQQQQYQQYQQPPAGGYYAPPTPNNFHPHPTHPVPPGGYYGPPGQYQYQQQYPPHQQPQMYYATPYGPPPAGYYQDSRGMSAGGGICAGLLSALACVCCLDLLLF